jgi:tripartite-type tricarboxylate transporter receptor subunit TctC
MPKWLVVLAALLAAVITFAPLKFRQPNQWPSHPMTMIVPFAAAYNQTLYKKPLYNAVDDFTPVALIAEQSLVLVVPKDFPADSLKSFTEYVKANTAKLSFGSGGSGSATHLGCVLLNSVIGVDVQHVAYRGSAPAMQDLIAGRINYLCDAVSTALPQINPAR